MEEISSSRPNRSAEVPDDIELLQAMMNDLSVAPDQYKPTNYWKFYERRMLPELKRQGFKNFRRRKGSIFNSFGATDHSVKGYLRFRSEFKGHYRLASLINNLIAKMPFIDNGLMNFESTWITEYCYWYVKDKFNRVGLDLTKCPTTALGDPEDLVEVEGNLWSLKHLNYCAILADILHRTKLPEDAIVCELGTGLGRNIEVMSRLFPKATFLAFDIPPQLYAANQYLSTMQPDRVIPYAEAIKLPVNAQTLERIKGKICVLPTWKMPEWSKLKINFFYNSESFQEMEVDVVKGYLEQVAKMAPETIYINALPNGVPWRKTAENSGGSLSPVLGTHYKELLADRYTLTDEYFTDNLLRRRDYMSYLFRHRP